MSDYAWMETILWIYIIKHYILHITQINMKINYPIKILWKDDRWVMLYVENEPSMFILTHPSLFLIKSFYCCCVLPPIFKRRIQSIFLSFSLILIFADFDKIPGYSAKLCWALGSWDREWGAGEKTLRKCPSRGGQRFWLTMTSSS